MSDRSERIESIIGTEFYTQPAGLFSGTFELMYSQILQAYREELAERENVSIMDFQLVECIAASYVWLRQRASDVERPLDDRNRREMLKDWMELCVNLKKLWHVEDKDAKADVVVKKLDRIVSPILNELPDTPENRNLKHALAKGFESL